MVRLRKSAPSVLSETKEQINFVKLCDIMGVPIIHIPNQGSRDARTGAIMRSMGLRRGFPDLLVLEGRGGFYGMCLEMKQAREYSPSERSTDHWKAQLEWLAMLNRNNYYALMTFGCEDALKVLKLYLASPPTT